MEDISIQEAIKHGIENKHSIMDTGEKRFRQVCLKDNTSYIRTEGGEEGYWQNSHYHSSIRELYRVQKGKILFVEYKNDELIVNKMKENDICKTEPNVPHNVYMYPNTVIHTVKYGTIKDADWIPFEQLDDILKDKTIEELQLID